MPPRRPIRPLDKSKKAEAYPKELLVDYTTGDISVIDESGAEHPSTSLTLVSEGTGNGVAEVIIGGRKVTIRKQNFLTEHPTITTAADTTNAVTPGSGGTFTTIDSVTRDANGHVTKVNTKTVTMPTVPDTSKLEQDVTNAASAASAANAAASKAQQTADAANTAAGAASTAASKAQQTADAANGAAGAASAAATKAQQTADAANGTAGAANTAATNAAAAAQAAQNTANSAAGTANNAVNIANGKATTVLYKATIGTGWAGGAAPFTQNVGVAGITANDTPIVDVDLSTIAYGNKDAVIEAYSKIYRITTYANGITIYADEKTTVNVPIQLKVIR